jgi:hypothetical protein
VNREELPLDPRRGGEPHGTGWRHRWTHRRLYRPGGRTAPPAPGTASSKPVSRTTNTREIVPRRPANQASGTSAQMLALGYHHRDSEAPTQYRRATMSGTNVAGRGLIDPKWEARPVAEGGIVVRIDDAGNPDFWLEIYIPRADLEVLLHGDLSGNHPRA